MGCGCKGKKVGDSTENSSENVITLGRIIKMVILIVLFIAISPIMLIFIWIIGINTIIGGNFNILDSIIKLIDNKNDAVNDAVNDALNDGEELELLDVDVIK